MIGAFFLAPTIQFARGNRHVREKPKDSAKTPMDSFAAHFDFTQKTKMK
jgi:hypothetical protein